MDPPGILPHDDEDYPQYFKIMSSSHDDLHFDDEDFANEHYRLENQDANLLLNQSEEIPPTDLPTTADIPLVIFVPKDPPTYELTPHTPSGQRSRSNSCNRSTSGRSSTSGKSRRSKSPKDRPRGRFEDRAEPGLIRTRGSSRRGRKQQRDTR